MMDVSGDSNNIGNSVKGFISVHKYLGQNTIQLTDDEFAKLQLITIANVSKGRFRVPFTDLKCIQAEYMNYDALIDKLVELSGSSCHFNDGGELKYLIDEMDDSIQVTKNTVIVYDSLNNQLDLVESVLNNFKEKVEGSITQLQ